MFPSAYSVMTLTALLLAGLAGMLMSKKRGIKSEDMLILMLIAGFGVVIGGHLLFGIVTALTNFEALPGAIERIDSLEAFLNFFFTMFGGSVFYGGLLGGIAAGMLYMKLRKLDIGAYTDVMALVAPLFHSVGRVGCFLGGCCYGVELRSGARFPVQLLEAAWVLAIFAALFVLFMKGRFKSRLFCIYLIAYAAGRFFIEFLRGDEVRGLFWGISTSQIISVLVLISAVSVLVRKRRKTT
jgi:phosphatidylglycerol:prolipoprotein diacylglycerol transferase